MKSEARKRNSFKVTKIGFYEQFDNIQRDPKWFENNFNFFDVFRSIVPRNVNKITTLQRSFEWWDMESTPRRDSQQSKTNVYQILHFTISFYTNRSNWRLNLHIWEEQSQNNNPSKRKLNLQLIKIEFRITIFFVLFEIFGAVSSKFCIRNWVSQLKKKIEKYNFVSFHLRKKKRLF